MAPEFPATSEIPYIPFNESAPVIKLGDFLVREYVPPSQMRDVLRNLSHQVRLADYEKVVVNLKGGKFLFKWLSLLQGYHGRSIDVEYHRPDEGYGAIEKIPVPKELQDTRVLVLDDIYDSGGVMSAIMNRVSPESQAVALVTKNGIPDQIAVPNILIGLRIDPKWVGGSGMDIGIKGEKDTFRNYPGLVVKIT